MAKNECCVSALSALRLDIHTTIANFFNGFTPREGLRKKVRKILITPSPPAIFFVLTAAAAQSSASPVICVYDRKKNRIASHNNKNYFLGHILMPYGFNGFSVVCSTS